MNNITLLIAVAFFVAAILVGSLTDHSWKAVCITWGLLTTGIVLFGIALTL